MVSGRQAEFDKQEALESAMRVFWKKGFVGASLSELTAAMGINKPSMYAAFGNKEALFVKAADNYINRHALKLYANLQQEEKSLKQRITDYLNAVLQLQCSPDNPGGCFISVAATEIASNDLPENALSKILEANSYTEKFLIQFFSDEIQQGNLSTTKSPEKLALILMTFIHGLAALARNNKKQSQLSLIIDDIVDSLDI
jgi:AcrR family transcriptional regulator